MSLGFSFVVGKDGTVRISRGNAVVTVLRGGAAIRFLEQAETGDPQQLMARATGNYRRGNERAAKEHPRSRRD